MPVFARRTRHWVADTFRFAWALPYWNLRKTTFVVRGRQGPCPCHNPSDDPVPGRVRCDAVLGWRNPARFRALCPLLRRNGHDWVCGGEIREVRPFWGRAAFWAAGAALAAYLAGATAVFAIMRGWADTPVAWTQVVWPGRWAEIKVAQAQGFFTQAIAAFRAGRLPEAHLALLTAQARDPGNYDANLLLGQIAMYQGNWAQADALFLSLLQNHPPQRKRTALALHDVLLANRRGGPLAQLCLRMAVEDREHAALWIRSLLVGLRLPGLQKDWPDLDDDTLRPLAPHARRLIRAQVLARSHDLPGALAELRQPHPGPYNPIYLELQVEMLARWGEPIAAQTLLDFYGPMLGAFEQGCQQFALDRLRHDGSAAQGTFRALLRRRLDAHQAERLAARLITHPAADCYRLLHQHLLDHAAVAGQVDGPTLWLAGLVCGAPAEAAFWRTHGLQKYQEYYPSITKLDFRSLDRTDPASPVHLVNALSFPWEISLALLERAAAP
jgi:hypothetical protein